MVSSMIQWGLQFYGGQLQLIDPDGSVVAHCQVSHDLRELLDHIQTGDVLNYSVGNV